MYACFRPSQKKNVHVQLSKGEDYLLCSSRCQFVIILPSPGITATFCEAYVRHSTYTIPCSRKSPSGPMFFYHQIVCEGKTRHWHLNQGELHITMPTDICRNRWPYTNMTFKLGMFLYHLQQFKSETPALSGNQQLSLSLKQLGGSLSSRSLFPVSSIHFK